MANKHDKKQSVSMVIKETRVKAILLFGYQIGKDYTYLSSSLLTQTYPSVRTRTHTCTDTPNDHLCSLFFSS